MQKEIEYPMLCLALRLCRLILPEFTLMLPGQGNFALNHLAATLFNDAVMGFVISQCLLLDASLECDPTSDRRCYACMPIKDAVTTI